MYDVKYNSRTWYVSNYFYSRSGPKGLLNDSERDLLAIAESILCHHAAFVYLTQRYACPVVTKTCCKSNYDNNIRLTNKTEHCSYLISHVALVARSTPLLQVGPDHLGSPEIRVSLWNLVVQVRQVRLEIQENLKRRTRRCIYFLSTSNIYCHRQIWLSQRELTQLSNVQCWKLLLDRLVSRWYCFASVHLLRTNSNDKWA